MHIIVTIEALVAGGRGRAVHDGMQVFVAAVVPGDRVRVTITKRHRQYLEGVVSEVLEPGPDRVTPRCPVFGACGGCQWQHLRYDAQVEWKGKIVRDQLRRIAKIATPNVLPVIAMASPWHYRSRIQLQVDDAGHVGFYRAGSHDIVEFDTCAIADAQINAMLSDAKVRLKKTGRGRHLRIDESEGFTQVNRAQNAKLQQIVAAGVAAHGGGRVLELYCGNGNLTFPIAQVAAAIVAADDDAQAIAAATQQAKAQGIASVTFHCTSAKRAIGHARDWTCDGVVLDPPRRGAPEIMAEICAWQPHWIGYVSCDPSTMARDVRGLIAGGYVLESCQPIDMFPQTFHIETLTWLVRRSSP
jgi:23S rRNA (uracil1939-C5)-methyltransferase